MSNEERIAVALFGAYGLAFVGWVIGSIAS